MSIGTPSETTPGERRSRRRQWLVGCGSLLLLFVAGILILAQDESPPDISDLLLEVPDPVPDEESCQFALLDLRALRSEEVDWESVLEELVSLDEYPVAWERAPLDRDLWEHPGLTKQMAEYYAGAGTFLDGVDDALSRPHGGWTVVESHLTEIPVGEIRGITQELEGRALWHRIRGDTAAASRDIERIFRIGDRLLLEGSTSILQSIVGFAIVGQAWMLLESLSYDGDLDPQVEARLIARRPLFTVDPEVFARSLHHEFRVVNNALAAFADGEGLELFMFEKPGFRLFYKRNRTLRRFAEFFRESIERASQGPADRRDLDPSYAAEGATRRAILSVNSGELLLVDVLFAPDSLVDRVDRLRVLEELGRWRLALERYERERGTLPATLGDLAAAYPELGAVPTDPFSKLPFRYDVKLRAIWSVGPDRTDDGAADMELLDDPYAQWFELSDWIGTVPMR